MKTLRRSPARRSFLGQASAKDDEVFDLYWKTVRRDGILYRVGYVVSNTKYFQPFRSVAGVPDSARQVRLYILSGQNAGSTEYTPLAGFSSKYEVIPEAEASAILAQLPIPSPQVRETALSDFYKTVNDGFSFAENALSQARLGNLKDAERGLDLVGAGAAAMLDKANFEIHELEDYGIISHAERADIMVKIVAPLGGTITDARSAIREGKTSSILSLWNYMKELSTRTAVQWEAFGKGKWVQVVELYKGLLGVISSLEESVAATEAVGDPELSESISRQKNTIALIKAQAKRVEDKIINLGVTRSEWNQAVGLGEMSALTAIIVSTVVATILQIVVNLIIESIQRANEEANYAARRLNEIRHERAFQKQVDEEERLKAEELLKKDIDKNTGTTKGNIEYLKKVDKNYPGMNLGPRIKALEENLKSGDASIAQTDLTSYVIAGAIGLALAVAIIWVKRKKESFR